MQEIVTITAPEEKPSIERAVQLRNTIDDLIDEIGKRGVARDEEIDSKTVCLRETIQLVVDNAEALYAADTKPLLERLATARTEYDKEIAACVSAGVMENTRHEIVNKAKFQYPINKGKFEIAWPGLWAKIATVEKVTAKAALINEYHYKAATADTQLEANCDKVQVGSSKWELTAKKAVKP